MMDKDSFHRNLEFVANYNGVPWGRLNPYWESEIKHVNAVRDQNGGSLKLIRTYLSLFLETREFLTLPLPPDAKPCIFYSRFFAKLVHSFQQLCAVEMLLTHGYPLVGYAQLRNTYDHLILISAAMQKITDFFKIEGYETDRKLDMKEAIRLRKNTESEVRTQMTGKNSGLSLDTIAQLKHWEDIFDMEVHGSRLSLETAREWIQGNGNLHVYPEYQGNAVAMCDNRLCEIGWMAHRLLPLLQHSSLKFPPTWENKWEILDGCFDAQLKRFTSQQEQEMNVNIAIIELVQRKFPFNAQSLYPLEGMEIASICE